MKQVPYKCRFGHITIVEYNYSTNTKGTVVCEECMKLVGEQLNGHFVRGKPFYDWIVKRNEKAVRI